MAKLSTLCYIEKEDQYLMLHRTVKENDVNRDKWIGVGGHFEQGESPEECLLREVWEETGYTLTSWRYSNFPSSDQYRQLCRGQTDQRVYHRGCDPGRLYV